MGLVAAESRPDITRRIRGGRASDGRECRIVDAPDDRPVTTILAEISFANQISHPRGSAVLDGMRASDRRADRCWDIRLGHLAGDS